MSGLDSDGLGGSEIGDGQIKPRGGQPPKTRVGIWHRVLTFKKAVPPPPPLTHLQALGEPDTIRQVVMLPVSRLRELATSHWKAGATVDYYRSLTRARG